MAEEEMDQWLASSRSDLTQDLTAVLDVEAGLRDVLLPTRRAAFVDDLRTILNLDSGLAAILPTIEPTADERRQDPESTIPIFPITSQRQVGATAGTMGSLPPVDRLALRGDPAIVGLAVAFQVANARDLARDVARALNPASGHTLGLDLARTSARDIARDVDLALDLARGLDGGLERALVLARASAHDIVRDIVGAIDLARGLERALERALDLARAGARGLARDLARAIHDDLDRIRVRTDDPYLLLARELDLTRCDFTEADLRAVDLTGLPLAGVRWSVVATRWPPDWQVWIEAHSMEIAPDLFEIRDGMAHVDTSAVLADR